MTGPVLAAWRDRRRDPLSFRLDGITYTVPEHPARVWVLAVLADEPADLLLDLLPDEVAADLWEDAADPDCALTGELLARVGQEMLARATGRPWWQAVQLIATLVARWPEWDARCADRGLGDPLDWPIERLCHWVHARLLDGLDEAGRARLAAQLATPATPAAPVDEEEEPDDAAGWFALAAQFGQLDGLSRA